MKNLIKNVLFFLGMMLMNANAVFADTDKPITVSQLPANAQEILSREFAGNKVALAKMETGIFDRSYEVIFTNGDKVEFDKSGNWTEVSCKSSVVPSNLIPSQISSYMKTNYPGQSIIEIEKDGNEYEVKLSNGLEITFNKKYQVVDID